MVRFKKGSLELRVLDIVKDHYPITKEELRKKMHVPERRLDLALRNLEKMGYVEYDVLPDKVFIRLKVIPVGPKAKRSKKKAERKERRKGGSENHDYSYV